MAKPIKATPVIKGRDAARIVRELREGTPPTEKRAATLKRARETFERSSAKSKWASQ